MRKRNLVAGLVAGALCLTVALPGCAPSTPSSQSKSGDNMSGMTDQAKQEMHEVTLHRGYGMGHGDRGFAQAVVAVGEDGTILGAYVDEYEYMAADMKGLVPVPNSDKKFGQNYAAGMVLGSKKANNEPYSANMKTKNKATQPWATSMEAIEKSVVGKKASDLTSSKADTVSGATLVDTPNYVKLIAQIAQNNDFVSKGKYEGDGSDLKFGAVLAAAHGEQCYTSAISLVQGDKIVATSIDDFQYMATDTAGLKPVPNSDGKFGAGAVSGQTLMSKSVNSPMYSKLIKEKGNGTQEWLVSMQAIENEMAGKSVSDKAPDTVSGATLVDTPNYAKAAVQAAKNVGSSSMPM